MSFDIIVGRPKKDVEKYATEGTIFIGKQYVQMGAVTSLANRVFLDIASSHVVFVVGKRGSGKSYSMGVIAEGITMLPVHIKQNLSVIMLDTMGVYWTMKYPNNEDAQILQDWKMEALGLDVKIFTPHGFYAKQKEEGVPSDAPFALLPADLNAEDWCLTFGIEQNSDAGVLISRIVYALRTQQKNYDIPDLMKAVEDDTKSERATKNIVSSHFGRVTGWGIFSKEGTPLSELAVGGQVTVLDMSVYATLPSGWLIRALVIGLISKKLFTQRMLARKAEELTAIDQVLHYFSKEKKDKLSQPLVWLIVDEAHEVLPKDEKTAATSALVTILREGRQPGISLILASQQPGKIHGDVITQSDVVIAHRLTAQVDAEALGQLTQTYMREGLLEQLDNLPRAKGSAVIFDDQNERVFSVSVRPRVTWHGGSSPTAVVKNPEEAFKTTL